MAVAGKEIAELEALLEIDEEKLPYEWQHQPRLFVTLARHAARGDAAVSEAELALKICESTLYRGFRTVGIPGIERPTEEAIKQAIRADSEWQAKSAALILEEEVAAIKRALMKAAEQRERSLKHLSFYRSLPLGEEDEELGRAARRTALQR